MQSRSIIFRKHVFLFVASLPLVLHNVSFKSNEITFPMHHFNTNPLLYVPSTNLICINMHKKKKISGKHKIISLLYLDQCPSFMAKFSLQGLCQIQLSLQNSTSFSLTKLSNSSIPIQYAGISLNSSKIKINKNKTDSIHQLISLCCAVQYIIFSTRQQND